MALQSPPVTGGGVNASFRQLDPAKYTSLGDFIDSVNKPDNREALVKTYGNQGITGFLQMTGAVKSNGTNDQVTYWEESRLHSKVNLTATATFASSATSGVFNIPTGGHILRDNDVVLLNGSVRCIVDGVTPTGAYSTASGSATVIPLAGTFGEQITTTPQDVPVVGNLHAQGSDQQSQYIESNVVKRTNKYNIVKEVYKVSGSQATNIGWINVGNGDYRWFIKGEMDTRQRFLDKREMMMILGESSDVTVGGASVPGGEGYFAAIQDRGLVNSGGVISSLSDLDAIITELDKQGAAPEYCFYANTEQMLAFDDMVGSAAGAAGFATAGTTNGSMAFGAFQNDPAAAVRLGFSSARRGSYTFHNKSWKLLNDPTLLAGSDFKGVMIPLTTVVDPKTGDRAAALEMNYKAANGYSRELEHWMTGSILGVNNTNVDNLQFNYRSESNLVCRAANTHALITA